MPPKKVLIADDDLAIKEVVTLILESKGFTAKTITDLRQVESEIDSFKPDVVLMDIWMSGFDGREITKKLKQQPATKDLPVIVMSAHNDLANMAKEAQADDYLTKPFDIDNLVKIVDKYSS